MRVAIFTEPGGTPTLQDVEHTPLQGNEVLVRIAGVGICHTDLSGLNGKVPLPTPAVLGHEGAGVVEEVGSEVTDLAPGDHVVLTFDTCGDCAACNGGHPAYCVLAGPLNYFGTRLDGTTTMVQGEREIHGNWFGQSSWGTHAVASARNAVRVDNDAPLHLLGPLGCGLLTGAGTVMNVLRPQPGHSIGFWGIGTVGLAGLMAARAADCETIVAVDLSDDRLALARELGATHTFNPSSTKDVVWEILEATGGLDCSMEAVGLGSVVREALMSLRSPGVCATVGLQALDNDITIDQGHLLMGRTLTGVIEGDADPHQLIPHLIDMWRDGRFPFDRLVTEYPLEELETALEDFHASKVIKPILIPGDSSK
jgi:aryl-alcohol dehydrogenase